MTTKLAIIVEWDNARLSDVDRAKEMLRRLSQQALDVSRSSNGRIDLMLVVDTDKIPEEVPRTVLAECVDENTWPGSVSLVTAPGQSYYYQKNYGVTKTDAEIIVFIDSDVVPDEGWLRQIFDAFKNPQVSVVGGETYLSTDSFYDRLCAAFWNFDVKKPGEGIYEARNFYANNVAFRREVVQRFPFPGGDTFRGQCSTLAKTLLKNHIKLFRIRSAYVSHPPPEGISHFIQRAVCQGHDTYINSKQKKYSMVLASPLGSLHRFAKTIFGAPVRILRRRRPAGLGYGGAVTAYGLSLAYSSLMLFGELATAVSPSFVRNRFDI